MSERCSISVLAENGGHVRSLPASVFGDPATKLVLLMFAIYVCGFASLSLTRHNRLQTQMNDLGNMTQAIYQASSGNLLMPVSNDRDGVMRSRFGIHANFSFLLIALPFMVWPTAEFLLLLTTLACGVAGLGIFFIARHHLGRGWLAVLPAMSFWIHPMVQDANLYDFHVITVATAAVVWMIWAFDTGRSRSGWTLFALAIVCQEDIPLITLGIGGYYCFQKRERAVGAPMMAVSLGYFIIVTAVVMPLFNEMERTSSVVAARHGWLGETIPEILRSMLLRPLDVLKMCIRPDYLQLPIYLALSGGIAAFRALPLLSAIVPSIFVALIASGPWMARTSGTYYWIAAVAIVLIGCIVTTRTRNKKGVPWTLAYPFWASVVLSLIFSPAPYGWNALWPRRSTEANEAEALSEIKRLIPNDACLSVQNNVGPQFALRADIASFPRRIDTAEYVLLQLRFPAGSNPLVFPAASPSFLFEMPPEVLVTSVGRLMRDDNWRLVFQKAGFYLFRRSGNLSSPPEEDVEEALRRDTELLVGSVEWGWRGDESIIRGLFFVCVTFCIYAYVYLKAAVQTSVTAREQD